MLDDCENHSASCCEIRLEPSPILTKVSAAGVGTTARPAQEELHKLFQAPFLRWFGRRAKTARPQAQEPTETRRPARTPRASSPPDSHGRGERPKSAAAGTLPALRAKAAAKGRPNDNGGGATTASGDGDSGD